MYIVHSIWLPINMCTRLVQITTIKEFELKTNFKSCSLTSQFLHTFQMLHDPISYSFILHKRTHRYHYFQTIFLMSAIIWINDPLRINNKWSSCSWRILYTLHRYQNSNDWKIQIEKIKQTKSIYYSTMKVSNKNWFRKENRRKETSKTFLARHCVQYMMVCTLYMWSHVYLSFIKSNDWTNLVKNNQPHVYRFQS